MITCTIIRSKCTGFSLSHLLRSSLELNGISYHNDALVQPACQLDQVRCILWTWDLIERYLASRPSLYSEAQKSQMMYKIYHWHLEIEDAASLLVAWKICWATTNFLVKLVRRSCDPTYIDEHVDRHVLIRSSGWWRKPNYKLSTEKKARWDGRRWKPA